MLGGGLFITLMVGANSYRSLQELIVTNQWVVHTYGILRQTSEVDARLVALDSDVRGYLLSGKTYFLTEFGRDADDAFERLRELQTLTRDNAPQVKRLRELESLLNQKLALNAHFSPDSAQQQLMLRLSRDLTQRVKVILLTIEREENDLLGLRVQASELSAEQAIRDGLIGIVIAVIIIIWAVYLLFQSLSERTRLNVQLRENEQRLKQSLEAVSAAVIVVDASGKFYYVNRSAVELLGEGILSDSYEEVKKAFDVFRYPSGEPYPAGDRPIARGLRGEAWTADDVEVRLPGRSILTTMSAQPVYGEDGRLLYVVLTIVDTTERLRAQERLLESEQQLRKFLEAVPTAIVVADQQGQFLYGNQTAHRLLGDYLEFENAAPILRPLDAYRYPGGEPYPVSERPLYRALQTHVRQEELMELRFGDQAILAGCTAEPVFDEHGELRFVVMSLKDVTDQTRASERLLEAKNLAETAARMKENFLANMSHEIRTPLNAITGFSTLLETTPLNTEQNDYLRAVRTASKNLLSIVNDILDISKIEAGMLQLEQVPFSIPALIESIHTMLQPSVAEKDLNLTLDLDPDLPPMVLGDSTRLTQILLNLAGNAVKFTERGHVNVRVYCPWQKADQARIRFVVEDTGIGIPADVLPHVFERFRQESTFTTRRYGGSGLGLNIVKSLVDMQGGLVTVESAFGKGSRFTVELPYTLAEDEPEETYASILAGASANGHPATILVVEDNVMNQKLAVAVLGRMGYTSEVAENGLKALQKLQERPYDLVLMDIQMPLMDGYETTRLIRAELHSSVPIIAMTAHALVGEREQTLQVGMNDFISKPFQMEELHRVIRKQLHLASTTAVPPLPPAPAVVLKPELPAPTRTTPFRLDYLRDITGDDPEAMAELLDAFLAQTPTQLADLRQALDQGDLPGIKRAAHTLKAPVKMLGLDEAAQLFTSLQELAATETPLAQLRPMAEDALAIVGRELPTIEQTLRTLQTPSAS